MVKNKFFGKLVIAVLIALIGLVGAFFAKPEIIVNIANNIINPNSSVRDNDVDASAKADSIKASEATENEGVINPVTAYKPEDTDGMKPPAHEAPLNGPVQSEHELDGFEANETMVESGMIAFTLKGVSLSGQTLKFEFIVNNNDVDRRLTLTSARIIDSDGIAFSTSEISLAKTSAYQFDLPNNVPVHMEVLFERINKDIESVSFLEIKGSVYGQKKRKIELEFKNININ